MHTLLIWEIVPEEIHFYLIPNSEVDRDPRFREWLSEAHDELVNTGVENDGLCFLNSALCPPNERDEKGYADPGFEEYLGIWNQYKQDGSKPLTNVQITSVYQSGFAL